MLLRSVEYARPSSLEEAIRLLEERDGARVLAGGQTLINVMKPRAASPEVLVDLNQLSELRGIELDRDGTLTIGAMTTTSEVVESVEARARPILPLVCSQIADVQVRNRGTIGGNVCANDPTNHLPPLMMALQATMTIAGKDGERQVAADEFFLAVYMTAVTAGEVLTKVTIPPGRHDGFASVTLGQDGTCIVNAAASLEGGSRVVIGCIDAVPVKIEPASNDHDAICERLQMTEVEPPSDVHASSEYRTHLAVVLAERALEQAEKGY